MTITLHAQPYDTSAEGFYFETTDAFKAKVKTIKNAFGDLVEEFEIQFIDGDSLDCALAQAVGLNQANVADYLECTETWEDWQKIHVIIALNELGYDFDPQDDPDHYGIDLYGVRSMRELAEEFVADGVMGDIPEHLQFYIDYDAIARDLAIEYTEIEIAGEYLIYRAS